MKLQQEDEENVHDNTSTIAPPFFCFCFDWPYFCTQTNLLLEKRITFCPFARMVALNNAGEWQACLHFLQDILAREEHEVDIVMLFGIQ